MLLVELEVWPLAGVEAEDSAGVRTWSASSRSCAADPLARSTRSSVLAQRFASGGSLFRVEHVSQRCADGNPANGVLHLRIMTNSFIRDAVVCCRALG